MAAETITKEDLREFGKSLLNQIRGLLGKSLEDQSKPQDYAQ